MFLKKRITMQHMYIDECKGSNASFYLLVHIYGEEDEFNKLSTEISAINTAHPELTGSNFNGIHAVKIKDDNISTKGKLVELWLDVLEKFIREDRLHCFITVQSKGLKKDASGVKALSDKDIENIKHGVANIVYTEKFSLRPRLYQTFYEFERYFRTGEVHQMSIIQRLFWSNNALQIIKANILIGTGTGDTRDALVSPVIDSHPELCTTGCNPHNQFLYSLAAFGLLGLAALIFFMLYAPLRLHLFKNPEFCAFFIVALCWMFAESSFMSYEGMTFASLFMSYFCLNTSKLK